MPSNMTTGAAQMNMGSQCHCRAEIDHQNTAIDGGINWISIWTTIKKTLVQHFIPTIGASKELDKFYLLIIVSLSIVVPMFALTIQ